MFPALSQDIAERARRIKLLVLDVDGVLTDGRLFIGSGGEILKAFHTHDGHGIKMLQQSGTACAVLTARDDAAVGTRVAQLGIRHYFKGVHDKKTAYAALREEAGVSEEACAFVGDDVIDLPVMTRCGLPVAVENAHGFVKQHARWITHKSGGAGAVREVCDLLMHAQGHLQSALAEYLK